MRGTSYIHKQPRMIRYANWTTDAVYIIMMLAMAVSAVINMWMMKIPPFGPLKNLFIEPD